MSVYNENLPAVTEPKAFESITAAKAKGGNRIFCDSLLRPNRKRGVYERTQKKMERTPCPFQDVCGRTRVRHWPKARCGNEVVATDLNPTPDNATTAPYPYSHFGIFPCSVLYHPPPPDVGMRGRMPGHEGGKYRQQHRI